MSAPAASQAPEGRDWDAVIIGAGPAGALAARALARAGRSVLLADRDGFPRHKVCGGCLNARAIAALDTAGLGGLPDDLGAVPIRAFHVATHKRQERLTLPGGMAVSRYALDQALVAAARDAGATVAEGWMARPQAVDPTGWKVELRSRRQKFHIHARACLIAAGLAGVRPPRGEKLATVSISPMSRIGAGALFRSEAAARHAGSIAMAVGRTGYVGITRVEDDQIVVAAALDADHVRREGSLAGAAAAILAANGVAVPSEIHAAKWRGTAQLSRQVRPLAGHRYLVLGDAAGYAEPFTGEGMAWAMTAGLAAAGLVDAHLDDWTAATDRAWTAWHWRHVGRHQRRCRLIAKGLRHPHLVDASLMLLHLAPKLARPVMRLFNAPLGPVEFGRWA